MKADDNSPRIEEYRAILKTDELLSAVTEYSLRQLDHPEEQMYMVLWAPTLVRYVMWVLGEASKSEKKRLYFLSRDAYPMYLVAKQLAAHLNMDLEIRYLRVSRYALRIPEYHLMGINCLDRIFLSGIDVSMYQILSRAGLNEAQIQIVCKEINYDKPLHRTLNRWEISVWKEKVKKCCEAGTTTLLDQIYEISQAAYRNVLGYLEQEGLLDNIDYAVVDSGWVGTIQKSIQNLLAKEKQEITITGYYFGLYEYPKDREGCEYQAYYFKPKGALWRKTRFSNCLYEVIYSEPCPMVKGYEMKNGNYQPIFSQIGGSNIETLQNNRDLLMLYIRVLQQQLDARFVSIIQKNEILNYDARAIVEKLYSKIMSSPNRWEAEIYGKQLFSDDVVDGHMRYVANQLSQKEIKDLRIISKLKISLGWSDKVIHESGWIEGTIVNAGQHVRSNLRAARRAKYITHLRQSLKQKKQKED